MFRAYCYFNPPLSDVSIALSTSEYASLEEADAALGALLKVPGMTGGGLETKIPGIGWVLSDEADTVKWLSADEINDEVNKVLFPDE